MGNAFEAFILKDKESSQLACIMNFFLNWLNVRLHRLWGMRALIDLVTLRTMKQAPIMCLCNGGTGRLECGALFTSKQSILCTFETVFQSDKTKKWKSNHPRLLHVKHLLNLYVSINQITCTHWAKMSLII